MNAYPEFPDYPVIMSACIRREEEPTPAEWARIDAYAAELECADLIRRRKAVAGIPPAEVGLIDAHLHSCWHIRINEFRYPCGKGTSQADADLLARETLAELLHYGTVPAGTIAKIERW